jgi:ATP-dependent DNA helicase RecQ
MLVVAAQRRVIGMPKNTKKPKKKAAARAASPKTKSLRAASQAERTVAKRSAARATAAKAKAKPLAKPKPKRKPKAELKASAPQLKARRAKLSKALSVKSARFARASKLKARIAKAPSTKAPAARSVILPPKPSRVSARWVVARAPRTPGVVALAEAALRFSSLPPSNSEVKRVPSQPAVTALPPSTGLVMRERTPRARVTQETWRRAEEAAARLGQSALSNEQRVAIRAALEGNDSLVVLVDDEQALACYQVAAQLLDQPTLVVSPIAGELKAQAEGLGQRNIPAVCLLPELSGPDRSQALARVARGGALLVLATPEALRETDVRHALTKAGIALFVAEEAHCASELAHELRPSYAELGATLQVFGAPPVMALTRVASSAVRRDICERLALTAPVIVLAPAVRDNLRIVSKLARGEARQASLVRLVARLELPGVVFCATPHDADSVYSALGAAGVAAHRYHAGMTPAERAAELSSFTLPGQHSVMVAVSAFAPGSGLPGLGEPADGAVGFGRGSGKRDVRFVVHYQSPASIEQYVREIQRAGGDGLPATCVLLHESSHRSLHEVMLAQQRFRATHLAELGRALESSALEGRTVTVESLALATGQSRRTTDRLAALLADAGVVSRTGGWVRVLCSAEELLEACRALGAKLYALREQDGRRLAAVTAFAESLDCKLAVLSRYLGETPVQTSCGRCDACSSELMASQESIAPQASTRRAVVQEFSVRPINPQPSAAPASGVQAAGAALSARLADFATSPRGAR